MITVFGATGTIGAPLLRALQAKSANVRAVSRNRDKCAALKAQGIAATALTGDGHEGKAYGLTGPEALDGEQIAALITQVTKREITVRPVPADQSRAAMQASGMDGQVAGAMVELASLAPKGYLAGIEPTIEQILGRPARRLGDFIAANKTVFTG